MVYDFGVKDGVFYQVLEKSKEVGALICVHAENKENKMDNYHNCSIYFFCYYKDI